MSALLVAFRHRLEWLVVTAVRMVVRVMPMSTARALGHGLGRAAYLIDGPRRRVAP